MNECYICTDTSLPLLQNVCMCKSKFVHPKCQERLVTTLEKNGECGVCKSKYKNITIRTNRRLNYQFVGLRLLGAFLYASIFTLTSLMLIQVHMIETMKPAIWCFKPHSRMNDGMEETCVDFNVIVFGTTIGMAILCGMCIFSCVIGILLIHRNIRHFPRYVETRCVHVDASSYCTQSPDSAFLRGECTQTLVIPDREPSDSVDTLGHI